MNCTRLRRSITTGSARMRQANTDLMLARTGVLDAAVARLTNIYGPRLAVNVARARVYCRYSSCGLLLGKPGVEIFGDGEQLRDPRYMWTMWWMPYCGLGPLEKLRVASVHNVGGPAALALGEIWVAFFLPPGRRTAVYVPAVSARTQQDRHQELSPPIARIERELQWKPKVSIEEGAARTLPVFFASISTIIPDPARTATRLGPLLESVHA